jgi:putative transposase
VHWLGIKPSYSRPRISDDNAFIEAFLRTTKYRLQFPSIGFVDLDAARCWVREFASWYNHEHRHSAIGYVSPAKRHAGQDRDILFCRHELYTQAREANPRRWARHTRNWQPIVAVTLNRERESLVQAVVGTEKESASAA